MRYKDLVLRHYPEARAVVVSRDAHGAALHVAIYCGEQLLGHYHPRPAVRQSHIAAWHAAWDWLQWQRAGLDFTTEKRAE